MMRILNTREVQTSTGEKQIAIELQGELKEVIALVYDYVYTVEMKKKLPYKPESTRRNTVSYDISSVIIK